MEGKINLNYNADVVNQSYKIVINRNSTEITAYQNLPIVSTHPLKADRKKKRKPCIPSDYAGFNSYNRRKLRRKTVGNLAKNNFEFPNVVMLTLTFEKPVYDLESAHYMFKLFVQRINSHFDDFKYLATFNKQKNGSWHYHVMTNFKPGAITNKEVRSMWQQGHTFVTKPKTPADFERVTNYLIDNMLAADAELHGRKGYLKSDNLEASIELMAHKEEDIKDFDKAFEKVEAAPRRILYETKNHLGIQAENVDEETGEVFTVTVWHEELSPQHIAAGYKSFDTIFTHLVSDARFPEMFSELTPATKKQTNRNKGTNTSKTKPEKRPK